jgi:asparagine synthase (glutamine-hydrolysing)
MAPSASGPASPGALVLVHSRGGATLASSGREAPASFSEGPLSLACVPGNFCALHIGARTVCLLQGALYDHRGAASTQAGAPPAGARETAAWLTGAYERAGNGLFASLRGDYWALLWDRERREGVVVCDQLGARTPYWTWRDGSLHLASELPNLLESLPRAPEPDALALAHWLMMSVAPGGRTLYAGVHRLPAAHLLALDGRSPVPRRYWEPRYDDPRRPPAAAIVEEVRDALHVAVTRRLAPQDEGHRAAVLLSGGLDSSAVAALSALHSPAISTYSAVFPAHPQVDESALIDATVARLGVANTRVLVQGGSAIDGAERFLDVWRSPPTSPNLFFWIPLLERAGADGISVMLDGEGGDEVFGFSPFLLADRLRHGRPLSALRLAAHWPGARTHPPREVLIQRLRRFGARGALPPAGHRLMRTVRSLDTYAPVWLPRRLARAWLDTELGPFAFKRTGYPRWWGYQVDAITRGNGPSVVFEQARRRAALAGVEARHPLVDVDLVQLMLSYDPELAFDVRYSRPLLRNALSGMLDDTVRLRRGKSFFDAVFHDTLAGPDHERARTLLDPGQAELGAYVDIVSLHRELFDQAPGEHRAGLPGWALTVWRAVTAELWLRRQSGLAPGTGADHTDVRADRLTMFQVRAPGGT